MGDIEANNSAKSTNIRDGNNTSTTKTIEVAIDSTNDLSYPSFTLGVQACSNFIQLLQFILLICVISENHKSGKKSPHFIYVVGQIFVFGYLSFSTVGEISALKRIKMRLCYQDMDKHHKNLILRDGTESNNWCLVVLAVFQFAMLVFWKSILSSLVLAKFYITEFFCPGDYKLINLPVSATQWLARMLAVFAELVIMILTIVASILVINGQDRLIDMLFNFGGVLVISQLDAVMSTVLPKYKITLIVDQSFDEDPPDFTRVNAEWGYVCFTMFLLISTFTISSLV